MITSIRTVFWRLPDSQTVYNITGKLFTSSTSFLFFFLLIIVIILTVNDDVRNQCSAICVQRITDLAQNSQYLNKNSLLFEIKIRKRARSYFELSSCISVTLVLTSIIIISEYWTSMFHSCPILYWLQKPTAGSWSSCIHASISSVSLSCRSITQGSLALATCKYMSSLLITTPSVHRPDGFASSLSLKNSLMTMSMHSAHIYWC